MRAFRASWPESSGLIHQPLTLLNLYVDWGRFRFQPPNEETTRAISRKLIDFSLSFFFMGSVMPSRLQTAVIRVNTSHLIQWNKLHYIFAICIFPKTECADMSESCRKWFAENILGLRRRCSHVMSVRGHLAPTPAATVPLIHVDNLSFNKKVHRPWNATQQQCLLTPAQILHTSFRTIFLEGIYKKCTNFNVQESIYPS